jgi:hypothetical protein
MPAFSPRAAMAEALVPDTAIRAAYLPATQARGGVRSFAVELTGGAGVFEMPEAAARSPVPAVLILHDALGADGRAASYVEQLLGANIAVLELREGVSPRRALRLQHLLPIRASTPRSLAYLASALAPAWPWNCRALQRAPCFIPAAAPWSARAKWQPRLNPHRWPIASPG